MSLLKLKHGILVTWSINHPPLSPIWSFAMEPVSLLLQLPQCVLDYLLAEDRADMVTLCIQGISMCMPRSVWTLHSDVLKNMLKGPFSERNHNVIEMQCDHINLTRDDLQYVVDLIAASMQPLLYQDIHRTPPPMPSWDLFYNVCLFLEYMQIGWGLQELFDTLRQYFVQQTRRHVPTTDDDTTCTSPKRRKSKVGDKFPPITSNAIYTIFMLSKRLDQKVVGLELLFSGEFVATCPDYLYFTRDVRQAMLDDDGVIQDPAAFMELFSAWRRGVEAVTDADVTKTAGHASMLICPFEVLPWMTFDAKGNRELPPPRFISETTTKPWDGPQTCLAARVRRDYDIDIGAADGAIFNMIHDQATFEQRWKQATGAFLNLFTFVPAVDEAPASGVVAAGGSVVHALVRSFSQKGDSSRQDAPKDIDLFVYGTDEEARLDQVQRLIRLFANQAEPGQTLFALNGSVITVLRYDVPTAVQIVMTSQPTLYAVLRSFDLDYVQCAYDGQRVWCTYDAMLALKHRVTCARGMLVSKYRFYKAWSKGFAPIDIPHDQLIKLMNDECEWDAITDRMNRYYFPRSDESPEHAAYMIRKMWRCTRVASSADDALKDLSYRPMEIDEDVVSAMGETHYMRTSPYTLQELHDPLSHIMLDYHARYNYLGALNFPVRLAAPAAQGTMGAPLLRTPPLFVPFGVEDMGHAMQDEAKRYRLTLKLCSNQRAEGRKFLTLLKDLDDVIVQQCVVQSRVIFKGQTYNESVVRGLYHPLVRQRRQFVEAGEPTWTNLHLPVHANGTGSTRITYHSSLHTKVERFKAERGGDPVIPAQCIAVVEFSIVNLLAANNRPVLQKRTHSIHLYPAHAFPDIVNCPDQR